MTQVRANGISLAYEATGNGDPVVFIHGVLIASVFSPVIRQQELSNFHCVTYARRGYGASTHVAGPTSIPEQAADCRALIAALDLGRPHIVGHSYGGAIALQLALDAPDVVRSLSLLEPALILGASAAGYRESLAATSRRAREAGLEVAAHEFTEMRSPGYRDRLDALVPGGFARAVRDAATTFEQELPSVEHWNFGETEAQTIQVPALAVLGEVSKTLSPRFEESYRVLIEWMPNVEGAVIPGATHLMQLDAPREVAEVLAGFIAKHRE